MYIHLGSNLNADLATQSATYVSLIAYDDTVKTTVLRACNDQVCIYKYTYILSSLLLLLSLFIIIINIIAIINIIITIIINITIFIITIIINITIFIITNIAIIITIIINKINITIIIIIITIIIIIITIIINDQASSSSILTALSIATTAGYFIVGLFCYICSFFIFVIIFLYLCLVGCSLRFTCNEDMHFSTPLVCNLSK
jgi:hypothetical protein